MRLLLEGSVGRARVPVPEGIATGFSTAVAGGIGWHLAPSVAIETRVMHTWHHRVRRAPLSNAWTISAGVGFRF